MQVNVDKRITMLLILVQGIFNNFRFSHDIDNIQVGWVLSIDSQIIFASLLLTSNLGPSFKLCVI